MIHTRAAALRFSSSIRRSFSTQDTADSTGSAAIVGVVL